MTTGFFQKAQPTTSASSSSSSTTLPPATPASTSLPVPPLLIAGFEPTRIILGTKILYVSAAQVMGGDLWDRCMAHVWDTNTDSVITFTRYYNNMGSGRGSLGFKLAFHQNKDETVRKFIDNPTFCQFLNIDSNTIYRHTADFTLGIIKNRVSIDPKIAGVIRERENFSDMTRNIFKMPLIEYSGYGKPEIEFTTEKVIFTVLYSGRLTTESAQELDNRSKKFLTQLEIKESSSVKVNNKGFSLQIEIPASILPKLYLSKIVPEGKPDEKIEATTSVPKLIS